MSMLSEISLAFNSDQKTEVFLVGIALYLEFRVFDGKVFFFFFSDSFPYLGGVLRDDFFFCSE